LFLIRNNKFASWCVAFCMGILFRYIYGLAKNLWDSNMIYLSFSDSTTKLQIFFLTLVLNLIVEITSSLVPAILCGLLLIYIFQKKALFFSIPAIAIFLVLSSRLYRFWQAPDLGMQISALVGPILSGIVFALTVWLLLRLLLKKVTTQVN